MPDSTSCRLEGADFQPAAAAHGAAVKSGAARRPPRSGRRPEREGRRSGARPVGKRGPRRSVRARASSRVAESRARVTVRDSRSMFMTVRFKTVYLEYFCFCCHSDTSYTTLFMPCGRTSCRCTHTRRSNVIRRVASTGNAPKGSTSPKSASCGHTDMSRPVFMPVPRTAAAPRSCARRTRPRAGRRALQRC